MATPWTSESEREEYLKKQAEQDKKPTRYIDANLLIKNIAKIEDLRRLSTKTIGEAISNTPTADVVEVVRCKDCEHFQPDFVWTDKGERRPYTEEEIKNGKIVTGDIGINCASRCERFGYWEENRIPVWFAENDFCSYGERKVD